MIYILLPVYNRKEVTKKFIKALLSQNYKDYKLVLIDDGSTDGTSEMVLSDLPGTILIEGDGNLWWAGSLQKGYDWLKEQNTSKNDIVLMINDDTEFDENFLNNAILLLDNSEKTLLKAWSIDKHTAKKHDGYIFADIDNLTFTPIKEQAKANCTSTRGLFIKIKDFFLIGGFYPEKLPHYLSDYEYTIRASRLGYKILCDNDFVLYSDSQESGFHQLRYTNLKEFFEMYLSNRNTSQYKTWINFVKMTSTSRVNKYKNIIKITYSNLKIIIKAIIFRRSK